MRAQSESACASAALADLTARLPALTSQDYDIKKDPKAAKQAAEDAASGEEDEDGDEEDEGFKKKGELRDCERARGRTHMRLHPARAHLS